MIDHAVLKQHVRDLLSGKDLRITPSELIRLLRVRLPEINSAQAKTAIRRMVDDRALVYTNHFSISHLELNRLDSVRVSEGIVLRSIPAHCVVGPKQDEIILSSGSAFGRGDHPTTRLALRGLDRAVGRLNERHNERTFAALDVGTGSGVLAIAAVMLGACRAIGLDTDPVACYEAQRNVRINGFTDSIAIVAGSMDAVKSGKFDLVMANLRPPTLSALMPQLEAVSSTGSLWVLSGFRPSESAALISRLPTGFTVMWHEMEQDWSVLGVGRAGRS